MQLSRGRHNYACFMTPEDALRLALPILREAAEPFASYGMSLPEDPRDFSPDPECSTEDERALHRTFCEAWDRGENPELPDSSTVACDQDGRPVAFVDRAPFGLGTTTIRNHAAEEALAAALLALGMAP